MKSLLLAICLFLLPPNLLALEVPELTGRINDRAGLLSPGAAQGLEQQLASFEREQSTQIAVLTVPSLEGDDIDQFAIRVAENWKIGQKGKDNGVILILARQERKVRIEVGMGLQGVLPDVTASHIIRDTMRPHLKNGDFDQGITAGVSAIMAAVKGEFSAEAGKSASKASQPKKGPSFPLLLLFIAVAALVLATFSRTMAALAGGAGLPLVSWFSFPGLGVGMLAVLAVAGLAAGLLLAAIAAAVFRNGGGGYGGGWGGGFGGGGFSSGGSSGSDDSFSGGGGDFDGGGSSDDY